MRFIFLVLFLLAGRAVIAVESPPANEASPAVLGFAIVPQQSPRELAKRWGPILQYLTEHSGVTLQFQTANSLTTYQQEMKAGLYDISFINAYYYVAFSGEAGYKVFAQEKDAKFIGIMVVRKDSPYQTVEDLKGKELAFPAPTAVTSMLAYTYLKRKNINFSPRYVISMDSVYRAVAKGLFPAGQGEMRTFGSMEPEIRDQLRILWSADPMPPFTFSAHPRVPPDVLQKVQKAMFEMASDPEGIELLKAINMKGIVPAQDSDYTAVRKLKLLTLEQTPKPD
ncbi:MAG: phosphate/phosphite/phosphonate ABC transporter substrate-binding protein [Gammaproteobacteria bacterium]|nr:phosphate/phosphite/phosphonate ABC transporter substrate-binding protein [Gammaproteobacteria bacterium]